jgi:hypothetical protein
VRSALEQTVACEVLVVTAAETKTSNTELLRRLELGSRHLVVARREKERSFPAALNQGIRCSASTRVGFLLSDDWLEPTAVEECLRHSSDIVCTGKTNYAADGRTALPSLSKIRTLREYRRKATLEAKASYLGHFFLFSKAKLQEVGGLDETIGDAPGIDDYDMIWVLLEAGATVSIVEKALYNKREHSGERLTLRSREEQMANLDKILSKHGVAGAEKERLIRGYSRWFGKPAYEVKEGTTRSW